MELRTYQAESVNDALAAIQRDFGADALVVHSRTFRRGGILGFGARQIVEVTVTSRKASSAERPATPPKTATPPPPAAAGAGARTVNAADPVPAVPRRGRLASRQGIPSETALQSPDRSVDAVSSRETPCSPARASRPLADSSAQRAGDVAPPEADQERAITSGSGPSADVQPTPGRGTAAIDMDAINLLVDRVLAARTGESDINASRPAVSHGPSAPSVAREDPRGGPDDRSSDDDPLVNWYTRLIAQDVSEELARRICSEVRGMLVSERAKAETAAHRPAHTPDFESRVRDYLLRRLAMRIAVSSPPSHPGRSRDGRPLTIALVGPTGVGKTTTVAKLAAGYKLRHRLEVGLIAADTYRIAAVEQLRVYAEIVGLPLRIVDGPQSMERACDELAGCDVVLIDTAGRAPGDDERIREVGVMLDAAKPHEVHLVLSSAASERALLHAVERFRSLGVDQLIFTKLDEALTLGVILNVMDRVSARLSFITTGQEVPEHVAPASAVDLAEWILDGGG